MKQSIQDALHVFIKEKKLREGGLSVVIQVTDLAKSLKLPIVPEELLTPEGTQVSCVSGPNIARILAEHGITRILAAEGGRTSRGSVKIMRRLVALINAHVISAADLDQIESFFIAQVRAFFAGKPFKMTADVNLGLRAAIRDIIKQATLRQQEAAGTQFAGAVIQHLVGAKLECMLGADIIGHNSFSTADAQTNRAGDFLVRDVAIHVTTAPGMPVVSRCKVNLEQGLRPIIVTIAKRVPAVEGLAEDAGIGDRIDVFEVEQFIALNLYEMAGFKAAERRPSLRRLVDAYNAIVDAHETDPSLKIELAGG